MVGFEYGRRTRRPPSAYRSALLVRILNKWPGRDLFGMYRFMPIFFVLGGLLEYSMIHWRAGRAGTNFYDTFKRSQAEQFVQSEFHRKRYEAEQKAKNKQ